MATNEPNTYDLGDLIRVSAPFTRVSNNAAVDPTAVYLIVTNPSGVSTTYTYGVDAIIVKDSTGNYHADLDANASGDWYYRWKSTGTGQAAEENQYYVRPARGS